MRYLVLAIVSAFLLFSCDTSEPEVDETIVEVVDETATYEESEEGEEAEEESEEGETNEETDTESEGDTDEDDRWASFVHPSITIKPYYYPKSEIVYSTDENEFIRAEIVEGDKLVFYYYEAAGDKIDTITGQRLADSGYKIGLIFAIDKDKTEFKLEKENFSTALAKYDSQSNTPEQGYFNVTDGTIEGIKISETEWEITTDIIWTIPANEDHGDIHHEFELSANFIPEPEE
ncbi:hypothetical protein [Gillisia sp. JM1]|uniref:hypothetical protein n=1 Tax=Gillisia sp. JM1 TaxID=1283286 RepID=UPI000429D965|nr:hypothetical protein [Gillisia sp. JM1]